MTSLPHGSRVTSCTWAVLAALLAAPAAGADDAFFRAQVAPVLEQHCLRCHGDKAKRGGLSLATVKAVRAGGDSGPAVVPRRPDDSLLVQQVSGKKPKMPRGEPPLTATQAAVLKAWVEGGAAWPDGVVLKDRAGGETGWSLRPLARPALPPVKDAARVGNPIDRFVLAKLEEQGLTPAPEADRRTLLRRLSFDLFGLPPSPDEVDAFVNDPAPDAYEKLVERLLASPRHGERWGRHWLDVVHYGDTHGYDKDKLRPNAWPYRDYVIRALNEDKPYARFVQEQVAGDVLFPGTRDGVAALGFLAAGPWDFVGQVELREGTLDKKITRNLDRDDMVATTMNTFVSLTVQCARCHDHKFDPVTQEDYYSLQAVFAAVDRADRPCDPKQRPEAPAARDPRPEMVFAAATRFAPQGSFTPTNGAPRPIFVLARGSEKSPRKEVGPGTVACVAGLPSRFEAGASGAEGERRAALARWITDPKNPLTWRSVVNRVWHYHFGRGLVDSPSDFGRMGSAPTHPELLDWLAAEFRDGGQSLKALHRLIVTSAAYRRTSAHDEANARVDAGNRFLWRANRRRLEAEAVRDAVLAASGKLDPRMGGPGFRPFGFTDDHSPHYKYEEYDPDEPSSHRRSVYRFLVRSVPDPFMETLDCADPSLTVEKRNETLTALQALALLNNRFMVRMAAHLAGRAEKAADDLPGRVTAAYRLALGRAPAPEERAVMTEYANRHGLANACRLILNTNEFCFVD